MLPAGYDYGAWAGLCGLYGKCDSGMLGEDVDGYKNDEVSWWEGRA
jgi:hypothetical protein